MPYFADHYSELTFPLESATGVGFRPAQLAAAQSVTAHFFSSKLPAIVTMPTGTGKTTVLMAIAFMLGATRVLVLTPSRLVREQIAENFKALADLKKIGALPMDTVVPRVFATEGNIGSDQAWEELRQYDVVVATVPSVSPREDAIPEPPADLFDVVLVDEAHHSPARTWSKLLDLLRDAKQTLFTATPFRRDEKEIKGKIVFTYDIRRANQDRVFGDITFKPVEPPKETSIDLAIAKATEKQFQDDRTAGLKHLVMVRTDTVSRAKELKKLYDDNTMLRLAFVNGQHTLKHVKAAVVKLRAGDLDGIVCVNMFGEGFNLPNLKIAAIHSPHKSLAITLQFIGRFARASQTDIGRATFLAEPKSSSEELSELYEAGAIWREIVQNLSAARIDSEVTNRDVLDSFDIEAAPDMNDFSLYTIKPYFHAKIFSAPDADLKIQPDFPEKLQVIFKGLSDPHGAAVYLTREAVRSSWSTDERFTDIEYDIFIFHHNREAGLLFICASRRHAVLYNRLVKNVVEGRARPISQSAISRALNDIEGAEFFSVGMRKRHKLGRIESYRMISGPSADKAIQDGDGILFDRGHCFGKGTEDGEQITIGVSASAKAWSNKYDRIPQLLEWCDKIAVKILSGRNTLTGSRLDMLSPGDELSRIPAGVIAMSWEADVYQDPPSTLCRSRDGSTVENDLLDFDLKIIESREGEVLFEISNENIRWRGKFSLGQDDLFVAASNREPDMVVYVGNDELPVAEFLNEQNPRFYCSDLSAIEGINIFRTPVSVEPFDNNRFETIDWAAARVDICKEKPDGRGERSIFEWLEERLNNSSAAVVFCDDGSGEIADFITISETNEGPRVEFFHCKASQNAQPGNRVGDLYDVCGQTVKSSVWAKPEKLLERLNYRSSLPSIRGYLKGTEVDAIRILSLQARQQTQFDIYLVQPGVKKVDRDPNLSNLLAAANYYLSQGGIRNFGIFGS